jgi:hypothetical protein
MDPYAPINGISLERYADLGAELDGITDPAEQVAKVATLGVSKEDWEAAQAGWLARMQDMSLMGQVATRYMQLYNAALAQKKGNASISFEEYCAVSAGIAVFGYEAAMTHYGISMGDWTTISAHWTTEMSRDPMNLGMRRNQLQEQETQRLRAGGHPVPVNIQRSAAGAAPAGGAAAYDPNAHAALQAQAGAAQQAASMQYAAQVMNQGAVQAAVGLAGAMNVLGGGTNLVPGRAVLVQWSDGNKYPATIMQNAGEQAQVVFPNGQQMWLETRYLTPA